MDFQATEFLGAAQRSALLALGRTGGTPSERKKLRRGKLLEMYTESPASSARREASPQGAVLGGPAHDFAWETDKTNNNIIWLATLLSKLE